MFEDTNGICMIHNEKFTKYDEKGYACETCIHESWEAYQYAEYENYLLGNLCEEPDLFKEK
jgi:hypothetical protein